MIDTEHLFAVLLASEQILVPLIIALTLAFGAKDTAQRNKFAFSLIIAAYLWLITRHWD